LPSLSVLGDVRVVTWNQPGETDAANAYRVSASCDAGATWTAPSDLAVGEGLAFDDAASVVSGGVFTAFWGEYAPDFENGSAFASSTDVPCTATAALAQTGSTTAPAALFAALALLSVGVAVLVARRRSAV
jgi:LPXTG-motif cell wall-anchored protein